ncbi:TPA: hypothetical protein N0F65_006092 [Lagenidium giganteum]|uniref:Peptidase C1A papain C-terminal domain-containing protein n=1 Tax=Lagenidium giganteum TaxID=4803 RepID=A0AAV2Z2H9_9STRA|nr:TPA: hypothetical protein N0F65_006092 [Lagenidium giganteum]
MDVAQMPYSDASDGDGCCSVPYSELCADDDVAAKVSERSLQEQDSVDWTTTGCVAPPKDQGHCGSCWAFASIGALESAYCLTHNNRLQQFSEQQVNSCATQAGGCNGGFPSIGLEYVRDNGGVCTETGYPYTSGKTQQTGKCNARSCKKTPLQISVQRVDASEDGFVSAIASQPIAVGVTAGNAEWKQYSGGVLSACSTTQLDHAVLAVGYGTDVNDNSPYFKIKNSWGSQWGEDGFIRLQRAGDDSACGIINTDAVFPMLKAVANSGVSGSASPSYASLSRHGQPRIATPLLFVSCRCEYGVHGRIGRTLDLERLVSNYNCFFFFGRHVTGIPLSLCCFVLIYGATPIQHFSNFLSTMTVELLQTTGSW